MTIITVQDKVWDSSIEGFYPIGLQGLLISEDEGSATVILKGQTLRIGRDRYYTTVVPDDYALESE